MATDLATLEVVIASRGGEAVIRELDAVAAAGEKAERATGGLAQAQGSQATSAQRLSTTLATLATNTDVGVQWTQRATSATLALVSGQSRAASAAEGAVRASERMAAADAKAVAEREALNAALSKAPPPPPTPPTVAAAASPDEPSQPFMDAATHRRVWEAVGEGSEARRQAANEMLVLGAATETATERQQRLIQATRTAGTGLSDEAAASAGLSRAQAELLARADRLAGVSNEIDVGNKKVVASYLSELAEVRALGQQMGVLSEVQERTSGALANMGAHATATALQMKEMRAELTAAATAERVGAESTIYHTRAMALQEIEAYKMDAALKAPAVQTAALGTATGVTRGGLNAMRASLTSMAAAALGTAPGVAQLSGALGTMAIGSGAMIGVLAGVAALSAAYDHITKKSREAKEAADAFAKSDAGIAAASRATAIERAVSGGRPGVQIDLTGPTKQIEDARKAWRGFLDELNTDFSSRLDRVRFTHLSDFPELNRQLVALRREFAAGHLTIDQFEHGLSELDRAFPGFEQEILETRQLGERFDEAAKAARRMAAETKNAAAEARALIATHGQPGTSFEQGGEAAVRLAEQRKALDDAQLRATAASTRGTFGVQDLDNQHQAIEQATASWKDYVVATGNAALANVSFAQALSQHNAAAQDFLKTAQGQIAASQQVTRTLQLQAAVTSGTGEIEKQRALNAAYRESALTLQILGIQLDAENQKRANKLRYQDADLAKVNALVDANARAAVQHALLNDQLDRENRLRAGRDANAGAIEAATHATARASMTGPDAEVQAIRDRAQEEIDAEQRAHDAKIGLTRDQQATEDAFTRDRIANIRAVEAKDLERVRIARQAATDLAVKTTVRDTDAETAGIQAMTAAELAGGRAVEQMRVQLAGNEAVQRALNDATARGTTLTDEQAAALRGSAEAAEQARINAEKLRAIYQEVGTAVNQALTDIFNRKNPAQALGQQIKAEVIAALSQPITAKITAVIAKITGLEVPASKQEQAARLMNQAADKMLNAANGMNAAATGNGTAADASTVFNPQQATQQTAFAKYAQQFLQIGGAAYGGYQSGYGIGASTQSQTKGAIGGAVSGAVTGAAVGGIPGAIVGGFAGFVGGMLGAADAAREAERALLAMGVEAHNAATNFHTSLTGDSLDKQKAELRQQYFAVIKQLVDANGGQYPAGFTHRSAVPRGNIVDDFNQAAEDYNNAIKKATADYYRGLTEESEDFHARYLRATGHEAEADAEEFANKQRRERQRLVESFGDSIDAQEQATLAAYDQAAAAEKAAYATGQFTDALRTAVRGGPSGFKLAGYVQEYATGREYPGQWHVPTPLVPPTAPLTPPTMLPPALSPLGGPQFSQASTSSTGRAAPAPIIIQNPVFNFPSATDGPKAAKAFLAELDKAVAAKGGPNTTRAAVLNTMTVA